ncbi:phage integrase N-terminal SAM-like domain-containing protein [Fusobacterium nucleatum]|uniref:phage integrase N-terminal SAM-like domain-containing protein n=1 Tax=Fusobacterium nucleatum TaxID=851 RepID=UPI00201AA403|nr:phage integrase N-terminal SAM-like domain-containing protein [Fusobacterium nucleatum]
MKIMKNKEMIQLLKMNKFYFDLLSLQTEMAYRDYSVATQKIYKKAVQDFLEETNKEVIDVKKEDVIRYLDKKLMELSVNTVLVELNALEFFFEEVLGLDITENIKRYKRVFKVKDFVTMEQFNILQNSVPERERLIYQIIKERGLFFKEIVEIKVEDIDYSKSTLLGKKISRDLARDLLKYAEKYEFENKIFQLDFTTLYYWNTQNTKKYLGKNFSIDDLRHSIALEIYIKCGKEEEAVEYLRLKDIYSLRQYYRRAGYQYFNN